MRNIFFTIFLISITTVSYAKSQNHSHGGRSHNHPLPSHGVKHRHGNGAYGIGASNKSNSQQSSEVAEQYTNIGIMGLKKLLSGNTLEVTIDNSYKIFWIIPKLDLSHGYTFKATEVNSKIKGAPKESLLFDGCTLSYYDYCFGDIIVSHPRTARDEEKFKINKGKTHFFSRNSGYTVRYKITKRNTTYSKSKYYKGNLRFNIIKGHSSKNSNISESYLDAKYTKLNSFVKHYRLSPILGRRPPVWTPSQSNKNISLDGKGKLCFRHTKRGSFCVIGEFKNALIKSGKLYVSNSKSTSLFSSVEKEQAYEVNKNSNLLNLIAKANRANENLINREISENSNNSSSSTASSSSYCGANDTCYKYIKSEKSGAAIVRCTKGSYTGQEKCLSYKKGKYATGCGLSNTFAHHHTLEKAANYACGQ